MRMVQPLHLQRGQCTFIPAEGDNECKARGFIWSALALVIWLLGSERSVVDEQGQSPNRDHDPKSVVFRNTNNCVGDDLGA